MLNWFKKDTEDPRVEFAKREKKRADEDHEEATEVIRMLEIEHKLNHYAILVESALRGRKK